MTADLRDIPFGEMGALAPDVIGAALARVLPDESAVPVPVAAFQSSV